MKRGFLVLIILLCCKTIASCGILTNSNSAVNDETNPSPLRVYPCLVEFDKALPERYGRMDTQGRSIALLNEIESWFPIGSNGVIYPDYVGGVFLDRTGRLTIQIVESRAEDAQNFISALGDWVLTTMVTYSERELNELVELLNKTPRLSEFAYSWGRATIENRVSIDLIRYTEAEKNRFREELFDSSMLLFQNPRDLPPSMLISRPLSINPNLEAYVDMLIFEQTKTSVTVEILNNSDFSIMTGYSFSLEFYDNGTWRVIPSGRMFLGIGLIIESGESRKFTKNLEDDLYLMTAELFRIRKDIRIDTWGVNDNLISGETHDLVAMFYWN